MNALCVVFVLFLVLLQFTLPRRFAFAPIVAATLHLGNTELFASMTPVRLIIIAGMLRAMMGGYFQFPTRHVIDRIMIGMGIVIMVSFLGHETDELNSWTSRSGLVLNILGTYIYGRIYVPDRDSYVHFCQTFLVLIIPLALTLLYENLTRNNLYYGFGAANESSLMRDGKIRASGPFSHPILAGTVGGVAIPLCLLLWREKQKTLAFVGVVAAITIVMASNSSTPVGVMIIVAGILWAYSRRHLTGRFLKAMLVLGILYYIIKGKGPWFLMARMDFSGGSTGYFRAALIENTIAHWQEWWLAGTDVTRHWMATGASFSPNHTDLTVYYVHLAVIGGLPLLILLLALIWQSLKALFHACSHFAENAEAEAKLRWCAMAAICAHAMAFVAVSYFGQMFALFYVMVGAVHGLLPDEESQSKT